MRDRIALWLITTASRLTTWGSTYDALKRAEAHQHWWVHSGQYRSRIDG